MPVQSSTPPATMAVVKAERCFVYGEEAHVHTHTHTYTLKQIDKITTTNTRRRWHHHSLRRKSTRVFSPVLERECTWRVLNRAASRERPSLQRGRSAGAQGHKATRWGHNAEKSNTHTRTRTRTHIHTHTHTKEKVSREGRGRGGGGKSKEGDTQGGQT